LHGIVFSFLTMRTTLQHSQESDKDIYYFGIIDMMILER
jgi:hypothetical protein